jgi:lipid A 3-O-deacylase
MSRARRLPVVVALLGAALASAWPARAASPECAASRAGMPDPAITLRLDNDLFGSEGQDQGYTHGLLFTAMSPNLADYRHDPCLPRIGRWLNRYFDWLHPGGFEQQNMVVTFGQAIFTPSDDLATELLPGDRPYAAALLFGIGYNARKGDDLHTTLLRFGILGPSARGKEVQETWHDWIDVETFHGWDHQLRDEPLLQLVKERMRRYSIRGAPGEARWSQDVILHWGGALGNYSTHANLGAEGRFGWKLPDDFGSTPLRPAGENTAPARKGDAERGWAGHFFATFDARWVLHDITLDGNSWKDSHSVEKKPFVADVGYGMAITKGRWKLAFARYFRSYEFDGQKERPSFGSITISRKF